MVKLSFEDLYFVDEDEKIKVLFLKYFSFHIDKEELEKIGSFKIDKDTIEFEASEKRANNKFNFIITKKIENELINIVSNKQTIYIHSNSGIPLIGNSSFGIIDRNSNIIEIKPVTGCNLDCIYCSVDEGKSSRKSLDYVIEKDYLVEELNKLIKCKECDDIEVHIGTHGEPLIYGPLTEMIKDISNIKEVKRISIDTNGILLTKKVVDELIDSGLTQLNLSLNAFDNKTCEKIVNTGYNVDRMKDIAEYIGKKIKLILAPVFLNGINDKEMDKIILFAKKIGAGVGIQNFLKYKHGRNPVKDILFPEFYEILKKLEKKYDVKLIWDKTDFCIKETKKMDKPFDKGDVIKARIMCLGRYKHEMIAAFQNRSILIQDCNARINQDVKVKIVRSKHNIFLGKLV